MENRNGESLSTFTCSEKIWFMFFVDTLLQKREIDLESKHKDPNDCYDTKEENMAAGDVDELPFLRLFCSENPVLTVCQTFLNKNRDAWSKLNLSRNFFLPSLNDESLRKAIFCGKSAPSFASGGTNYAFGFQFGESEYLRLQDDTKLLEDLFPFPTVLPSFQVLLD